MSSLVRIFLLIIFYISTTLSVSAREPELFVVKNFNFGSLMFLPGSCQMDPLTGSLTAFSGRFLCTYPINSSNGEYIIKCDPHRIIRIRIITQYDNGNYAVFTPRVRVKNEIEDVEIYNEVNFVEIDSGDFGQVNIYLGGELNIIVQEAPNTRVNFSIENGLEWEIKPL
ncbi:MAG: hypothetical protein ACI87J_002059 [Colwellia sp.]